MAQPQQESVLTKLLYRYDEVAELLSVSVNTVRNMIESGDLERIHILAREPRITRESIESYIRKQREKTSTLRLF